MYRIGENEMNSQEVITYMSYDEWNNINNDMEKRRLSKRFRERRRKAEYYKRQRFMGVIITLIGIICMVISCIISQMVLQAFGAVFGIVGLYTILTKQMILVDNYYLEHQDRINEI